MTEFGREYGEGLYALCAEEKIEREALKELQTLKTAFRENADFVKLLANLSISKGERTAIVDETFKGKIHVYVLNFLKILVERGAIQAFPECVEAYQAGYNRDHAIVEARVTTAKPLRAEQREKLIARLREMTGKDIAVREVVDPAVMGGILLEMDGKRYDNTVLTRLKTIKRSMSGEAS